MEYPETRSFRDKKDSSESINDPLTLQNFIAT
jgi:hypothetical protein